jgi:hypothetical protein
MVLCDVRHVYEPLHREVHQPREEAEKGESRVSGRGCVGLSSGGDLTASADTTKSVKHARTHEADESKHGHLEIRVVVNSPPSFGAFEDLLALGARVDVASTFKFLLRNDVRHGVSEVGLSAGPEDPTRIAVLLLVLMGCCYLAQTRRL